MRAAPRLAGRSLAALRRTLLAACVAALAAAPCAAQESDASPRSEAAQAPATSPLEWRVTVGARSVDVTGDETRYRQDVSLDNGLRVLDLGLRYVPADAGGAVDLVELDASNLGGDPYEQLHLEVRKYGAYELELDHRKSQYFYDDTIVPASLQNLTRATGGDFHTFDIERVRDSAALAVDLSPATKLRFGLERQTRSGDSAVPRGIQRDQFELSRPIDESLDGLSAGVEHRWDKVTLIVDERVQTFGNAIEMFLPTPSAGDNTADLATLSLFALDQSYDYRSRGHTVRVLLDPLPRVDLNVVWHGESLDLDTAPKEQSAGTTATGAPFTTNVSGEGAVERDADQAGVDFGVAVGDRIRVVGAVRDSGLDQSGRQIYGLDLSHGLWNIDTTGYESGVELAPFAKFMISVGLSAERRDAEYFHDLSGDAVADDEITRRRGYFARVTFNPSSTLEVDASVETNDIDDPYTLSSPTDSRRYKLKVRQRWDDGWSLSGSYRRTDLGNTRSGWAGDTGALALRTDYRSARLAVSIGVGRVDLGRRVDQTVTGGTRTDFFPIDYEANVGSFDASASWRLNVKLTLGTELRGYTNHGSFPTDRDDRRGYVAVDLGGQETVQVAYRYLHYREDGYDDYDAKLVEVALVTHW